MTPLKILVYAFCTPETGYGHIFRSLALAQAAKDRGHTVAVVSNRKPPGLVWYVAEYLEPLHYSLALKDFKPDWVVVDLPHTPPAWIKKTAGKAKILTLNGIGYNQNDGADLRVIQGCAEVELPGEQDKVPVLKGLEYIILRPEIAKHKGAARGDFNLCWGGGVDSCGLLEAVANWLPNEPTFFVVADMTPVPLLTSPHHWVLKLNQDSDDLFWWLSKAKRLITAFGMVVPEALFLGTKVFSINASQLHQAFAAPLAEQGLIKNYPAVGLPSREEMVRFLGEPFEPAESNLIGADGAAKVMQAIEERS